MGEAYPGSGIQPFLPHFSCPTLYVLYRFVIIISYLSFFFFLRSIYLKVSCGDREGGREKERNLVFTDFLPRSGLGFPHGAGVSRRLGLVLSWAVSRQLGFKLQPVWDADVIGGGFTSWCSLSSSGMAGLCIHC